MFYKLITSNIGNHYAITKPRLSKIGKLFVGILLIVIFEGAFRKWISTGFTIPLVLFRDSMALYGIFWALKSGNLKVGQNSGQILLFGTIILFIWGLLQLITGGGSLLVYLVGIRFWLLYLWFAYVAGACLTEYDFIFIEKVIIITLLAMTPLAVMQHFLPPAAFLNKQIDTYQEDIFIVVTGIVRTTGTFSFTAGFTTLLAVMTPFVLASLVYKSKSRDRKWIAIISIVSLVVATITSGSRAAIIFLMILFVFFLLFGLLYSKSSRRGAFLQAVVLVFALFPFISYFLSRSIEANLERFESASEVEDLFTRIFTIFFGDPDTFQNLSLIGKGLGVGSNFGGSIATGVRSFLLAETETSRVILEGGLLGFAFIALKLLVVAFGLYKSWFILRSSASILPFLLWITTSLALFTWPIIGQLTINALGYLLLGLAVASLRLFTRRV